MQNISELRQDIVSGDWVVIATGRAKRPQDFGKIKPVPFNQSKAACPFEKLHPETLLALSVDGDGKSASGNIGAKQVWWVQAIPNRYPAFATGVCDRNHRTGPYEWTEGVGAHEVVITRDHRRAIAEMTDREVELLIQAFHDRYVALKSEPCVEYISIFQNYGRESGASISHPHSQIIAIPVIPPDIRRSLDGSAAYFRTHGGTCVHCDILSFELKTGDRLIYKEDDFVVLAPFASKTAFEMRIFPVGHYAQFEALGDKGRKNFARVLRIALAKLARGLNRPDYNFFIHTAPVHKEKEHAHYHWHLEIVPKTAIWAGFEIGTGIEISSIAPETAAEFLRKIKV